MKRLKNFSVKDIEGGYSVTSEYNEIEQQTGDIVQRNQKDTFFAEDDELLGYIEDIRSHILSRVDDGDTGTIKLLIGFLVMSVGGGDRVTYSYSVIDAETGSPLKKQVNKNFYVTDDTVKSAISSIREHIKSARFGEA